MPPTIVPNKPLLRAKLLTGRRGTKMKTWFHCYSGWASTACSAFIGSDTN
jgi:hypothetical protein